MFLAWSQRRWVICVALMTTLGWVGAEQSAWAAVRAATRAQASVDPAPSAAAEVQETASEHQQPLVAQTDEGEEGEGYAIVGWLELCGPLRESPPPFAWISETEAGVSLRYVLSQLQWVAEDEAFAGVVIYLDEPDLTLPQIQEITEAIRQVREAGAKVLVFAEQYDLTSYLLACSADKVLLQRKGLIELSGLSVEELYLAGLLEKLGIKADFFQVGAFKGASEPLTQTGPSQEWNQNMEALLDDLYRQIVEQIASARHTTPQQVEQLFKDCWSLSDEQYVQRGLIDALVTHDLIEVTGSEFGEDFEWEDLLDDPTVQHAYDNPFALFRMLFQKQELGPRRASLAVIYAGGPITLGESTPEGPFGGETTGSRTTVDALLDARDDDLIKGVLIRVDSPGGSALASELIWQAVHDVAQYKPVYVSINSMAASGGYYVASAASRVYVSPSSIVGSIGVVGGKIVFGNLYEKLGLGIYRRNRGPLGDMFNTVEPFTAEQRAALQASFDRTYQQFTDRVKTGRGERIANIEAVAQGRLFTGQQAVQNGLADEIGGVEVALAGLAEAAGLKPGEYDLIHLPAPRSLPEVLQDYFSGASVRSTPIDGVTLEAARATLGAQGWRSTRSVLNGLMLLRREPVLTLLPVAIMIH